METVSTILAGLITGCWRPRPDPDHVDSLDQPTADGGPVSGHRWAAVPDGGPTMTRHGAIRRMSLMSTRQQQVLWSVVRLQVHLTTYRRLHQKRHSLLNAWPVSGPCSVVQSSLIIHQTEVQGSAFFTHASFPQTWSFVQVSWTLNQYWVSASTGWKNSFGWSSRPMFWLYL